MEVLETSQQSLLSNSQSSRLDATQLCISKQLSSSACFQQGTWIPITVFTTTNKFSACSMPLLSQSHKSLAPHTASPFQAQSQPPPTQRPSHRPPPSSSATQPSHQHQQSLSQPASRPFRFPSQPSLFPASLSRFIPPSHGLPSLNQLSRYRDLPRRRPIP